MALLYTFEYAFCQNMQAHNLGTDHYIQSRYEILADNGIRTWQNLIDTDIESIDIAGIGEDIKKLLKDMKAKEAFHVHGSATYATFYALNRRFPVSIRFYRSLQKLYPHSCNDMNDIVAMPDVYIEQCPGIGKKGMEFFKRLKENGDLWKDIYHTQLIRSWMRLFCSEWICNRG